MENRPCWLAKQRVTERERNTKTIRRKQCKKKWQKKTEMEEKVLFWLICRRRAKEGKWNKIRQEEKVVLAQKKEDGNIFWCVRPWESSPKSHKWSVFTWAIIPMNEYTSTQVNNPDNTIIHKEWCCNNTLLTQHIMRWQGSGMNCWHRNSSTIMR